MLVDMIYVILIGDTLQVGSTDRYLMYSMMNGGPTERNGDYKLEQLAMTG